MEVRRLPDPTSVELVAEEDGVCLLRLDAEDECVADTWDESIARAKAQANFEYGIEEGDWWPVT